MIDLSVASELLDMGKRIGAGPRADEQLRGAVAIHNILERHRRAYLADEVGMGKTYVALGAVALFRHFNPDFRVLVIAPRQNIQKKWQKELTNFVAHNVRFPDLRIAAPGGRLARPLVSCDNLVSLVTEASIDPHRDFFIRTTSFSLASTGAEDDLRKQRDALKRQLPWLQDAAFDLRNKSEFKKNFARAVCCALPKFDLVIVDEAHNLKHGVSPSASARNQALAEVFGRSSGDVPSPRLFPAYGPRAQRVLFLSATPLEDAYRQLWNQLDVFGLSHGLDDLKSEAISEERKKALACEFLVRRVTSIPIAGREHTKNTYRREWRAGGVVEHDEPIRVTDARQRLVVALVQKKVSELLSGKRFGHSFQIGMLASFESFLETARLKRVDEEAAVFDDSEQTDKAEEREGLDVRDINRLARHYKKTFNREMPHPKMDAVVEALADAWVTGKKALVFVRRVASVKELKKKLDERYDDWLIAHVREQLPESVRAQLDEQVARYRLEKDTPRLSAASRSDPSKDDDVEDAQADSGGEDTFFAWYFRGKGPAGVVSGANIQARFVSSSGVYATFFADNHVLALLGAEPGQVALRLAEAVALSLEELGNEVRRRAAAYISSEAKSVTRGARMEAAQAAAIELLRDAGPADLRESARIIHQQRYQSSVERQPAKEAPPEIIDALETETFFTRLRRPEHSALRDVLWPKAKDAGERDARYESAFREQELRAQLLSTAARLGHAFVDLYSLAVGGRNTLALRRAEDIGDDAVERGASTPDLLGQYLALLERQRTSPGGRWAAWHELSEIASNFELILDVNAPDAANQPLAGLSREVGQLLRRQEPVGGMSGQVNQTLLRQFRMPGYPFVLVTTDILQEGEDLHTFCSSVIHYGISWTPSAMEQRIGRIDRVRSHTDRRLSQRLALPTGSEWLQVHYPYLEDTVEVLQVERVLNRVNTFLRLMHEGLQQNEQDQRKIDVRQEMVAPRRSVSAYREPLRSAFPLPQWAVEGDVNTLAVPSNSGIALLERFGALSTIPLSGLDVDWSHHLSDASSLLGTALLPSARRQPFTLLLRAEQGLPVLRCISPIGRTHPENDPDSIEAVAAGSTSRVGAILTREARSYDLTVEDDVILAAAEHDAARVALLIGRVVHQADRMERKHFQDGRDAALIEFKANLMEEQRRGH